jgi:hypothetical protein
MEQRSLGIVAQAGAVEIGRLRRMLGIWWVAAARELSIDASTIATEEAGSPASHRRETG